jgi:hypothetical protein
MQNFLQFTPLFFVLHTGLENSAIKGWAGFTHPTLDGSAPNVSGFYVTPT